jgi:hypothetical protein
MDALTAHLAMRMEVRVNENETLSGMATTQHKKALDGSNPYRETFVDTGVVALCSYCHTQTPLR